MTNSNPALKASAALVAVLLGLATAAAQPEILGKIDFPTSGSGEAQKHFIQGVLYLHSFEFDDAREEFQQASRLDPDFAMAYWGESVTYNHPLWRQVDVEAGRAALQRLAPTTQERLAKAPTQREKDFLASLDQLYGPGNKTERDQAYHDALQAMYEKYPGDQEVACLYALSILGLTDGTRDHRNYMQAASIAEQVFAENPQHPGAAHYLIHSYDDPIHAPLGLRAARVYNKIAPAASHAQHMISHIYVALGRWDESSTANEKAWAVSQARIKRKHLGVNQLDFHSFFWLHYSYLQQGRYQQAQKMLKTVEEARREPEGGRLGSYHGRMRAQQVVETQGRLTNLPPSGGSFHDHFADGLEAIYRSDVPKAQSFLEKMTPDQTAEQIMRDELQALILFEKGDRQKAVELMQDAARREDAMPLSYGPPMPSKPTHELLGETLLRMGHAAEAQQEFELSLQRAPRRALSLLGLSRAAAQAGDPETAAEAAETLRSIWHSADPEVRSLLEADKETTAGSSNQ